ncbi:MAG: hypothetical protein Q8942_18220 [Bacillota bacterium]|nr:hypothetical protein [Bacillota bacterium]
MSDDLNKKIKQITDIFGQENIPDNVKGLLSLLVGPGNQSETDAPKALEDEPVPVREENKSKNDQDENIEMIKRARKMMERLNTKDDPRINLLYSMRPFLNNSRQKKIVTCVKLLQMYNLSKLMDDDKGFFI